MDEFKFTDINGDVEAQSEGNFVEVLLHIYKNIYVKYNMNTTWHSSNLWFLFKSMEWSVDPSSCLSTRLRQARCE